MRSKLGIILAVIIIAFVVLGFYFLKRHEVEKSLESKGPAKPVIVSFAKVKRIEWPMAVRSVGTINSKIGVTLRAQVAGRVTQIKVRSGHVVKKGQTLFIIYPDVLEAELKQAESQVEIADFMYTRMKRLYQERAVSQERFIEAESNLRLVRAKVAAIKARLALTNTYAPFDGIMGLTKVNPQDYVIIGSPLATFQSADDLRVDFSVPQKYAGAAKLGDEALIQTGQDNDKIYTGKIYALDPLVNPKTRMLEVRADIKGKHLLPGMFAEVTLLLDKARTAIAIPQTAVVHSLHGDFVYLVKNKKPEKVFVRVGERRRDLIAITFGLKAGDVVVSAGQLKIQKNSTVTDKGAIIVKQKDHSYDGT